MWGNLEGLWSFLYVYKNTFTCPTSVIHAWGAVNDSDEENTEILGSGNPGTLAYAALV